MRKVKVFYTEYRGSTFPKEKYDIDKQINEFIFNNNVDIIDIKFASHFDDGCNDDLSAGLLIYEDKSCDDFLNDNVIHVDYSSLIDFVNENCIVDRNVAVKNRVKLQDFKNRYSSWCFAHFRPEAKINHEVIKNVLCPRFGTKIVKNSTNYLSNLKWVDNYRKPYEKYPENKKEG